MYRKELRYLITLYTCIRYSCIRIYFRARIRCHAVRCPVSSVQCLMYWQRSSNRLPRSTWFQLLIFSIVQGAFALAWMWFTCNLHPFLIWYMPESYKLPAPTATITHPIVASIRGPVANILLLDCSFTEIVYGTGSGYELSLDTGG